MYTLKITLRRMKRMLLLEKKARKYNSVSSLRKQELEKRISEWKEMRQLFAPRL